jgi:hypothetical protein
VVYDVTTSVVYETILDAEVVVVSMGLDDVVVAVVEVVVESPPTPGVTLGIVMGRPATPQTPLKKDSRSEYQKNVSFMHTHGLGRKGGDCKSI